MKKLEISDINPMRAKWPALLGVILLGLAVSYFTLVVAFELMSANMFRYVCGVIALLMALFLGFYNTRKNVYGFSLGSLQSWAQAHVYIGVILIGLIYAHMGFNPNGSFGFILFLVFAMVIASGVLGSLIYKIVPLSLSKYGVNIPIRDEIEKKKKTYCEESDKLIDKASGEFKEFYRNHLQSMFDDEKFKWRYMIKEENEVVKEINKYFENLQAVAPKKEIYLLGILKGNLVERERLSFKLTKLSILRGWQSFHAPMGIAMLTLVAIHVLSLSYY